MNFKLPNTISMITVAFVCSMIRFLDGQSVFDQTNITNQIMVVNMLQNLSNMYSSHYRAIKCVGFEPIHYANNLYVVSSPMIFYLSMYS